MNAGFTAEQEQLRRTVRDFAGRELAPAYMHWDRSGEFPTALWRRMGELGLCGARVPAEYEGQEMSAVTTGIVAEEVARGDFNLSYAVLMTALCGEVLRTHGLERVKQEWMRPMALGHSVIGLALTEPGSGSDAKAMRSTARRDGDDYVLNGEKTGISLMMAADALVLFAKTDPAAGARGVSAFLVPTDLPGVTRTPLVDMGSRGGRPAAPSSWTACGFPKDYLLGQANTGFYQVMQGFDFSRFIIGLMCIGAAEVSRSTRPWPTSRSARRSAARWRSSKASSFPIAEHATLVEAAKWLCYRGLWLRDAGQPHTKEAAMVKFLAPKVSVEAIHECLLLHGHYGYTQDLPIEQRLRDVIGLEIGDGTAQVSKIIIARELMGRESLPY